MAIYRLLRDASFDPEHVQVMTQAYEQVLRRLTLDRTDPITERIASKIVELAQSGLADPTSLSQLAIESLNLDPEKRAM